MIDLVFWIEFAPERASNLAESVDFLFYALLLICGGIAFAVFALIFGFCIRYYQGSKGKHQKRTGSSTKLEITWMLAALILFLGIFVSSAVVYIQMSQPPDDAYEIQIVGKQWMWKAQHPNGRREVNELHLLVDQPVRLLMTSQDVIHSFYIPAFRTKQDAVPGKTTQQWFTPTRPGEYHLFCAEYCGMDHSRMIGKVHVMEAADHERWLEETAETPSLVATGQQLFIEHGCAGCHLPDADQQQGPLLQNVYGSRVVLSDQDVVMADEQYLYDAIMLPQKHLVAGYEPIMPTYQNVLSSEEVLQLIAYIKSLSTAETAP